MMISALLLLLSNPIEGLPTCDKVAAEQGIQQEMNICAHRDFLIANAKMREEYASALAIMRAKDGELLESSSELDGKPSFSNRLIESQRHWVMFREQHCRLEGYEARGGSLEPLLASTCMTALTEARTQQLRALIETY
ncbi:lysozyme inhibitor LprI family protein [uncultured Erythrobacter sp.]|uniref:lysozyme inhibitor LprI family protein n=1 Tax=uncultured Erythrobacter sp. TaxID=263913 RepID=UPI0026051F04|nr:lysozyme inhibitor LprI family protein [uncultured Erythrobacter sp.]